MSKPNPLFTLTGCLFLFYTALSYAQPFDLLTPLEKKDFEDAERLIHHISQRDPINIVTLSPDGKILAAGHTDSSIRLWETYTGREIRRLHGHEFPVVSLTFDATGKRLISSAGDNSVRVWDVKSGQEIDRFLDNSDHDDDPVKSLAITPDNQTLVSATYEGQVLVRDLKTREIINHYDGKSHTGEATYVTSTIDISHDGRYLAYGLEDGKVCVLQLQDMTLFRCFNQDNAPILAVRFNPKGDLLATSSESGQIRLWALLQNQQYELKSDNKVVHSLAFSPESNLLVTGDADGTLLFWDVTVSKVLKRFKAHHGVVKTLVFNGDGTVLASGSTDTSVGLWDVNTAHAIRTLGARPNQVLSVVFNSKGDALATGSLDGSVRLWDSKTGKELKKMKKHTEGVFAVAFSPEGQYLASGSSDRNIYLWDVATGTTLRRLEGHTDPVFTVAFSPDGQILASGSSDSTIRLWRVSDGQELAVLGDFTNQVLAIAFSPDGKIMASGSWDGNVRLWDIASGKEIKNFQGHTTFVRSVAFSPNGKTLASGSRDNTVILWDVATGHILKKMEQETDPVFSVAFSPQGDILASGSRDNAVILWQVTTGHEMDRYQGHSEPVTAVTFSPDGRILASGSRDNTVRLWNVATGQLRRVLLGDETGRWLSCEEKQCLCFDNDTVWSKTKGYCTKRLTPPELQRTGSLSVEDFANKINVVDGELTPLQVTVKNVSQQRVYWTQVVHVPSTDNRLVLHAPDALAVLEAGQKYQFNLNVSIKTDYLNPKNEQQNLRLHINSAQADPIILDIKVTAQLPQLKLAKAVLTEQNNPVLGVGLTNQSQVDLSQSIFRSYLQNIVSGEQKPLTSEVTRPSVAAGKTELISFVLNDSFQLDDYQQVLLHIRKTSYPSHVWQLSVDSIETLGMSKYYYIPVIFGLFLLIFIYYYRLYRHPLVTLLSNDAHHLLKLPLYQLPQARQLLRKTQRLSTILTDSQVHHKTLDEAIAFLSQSPAKQAKMLGQRLGNKSREPIAPLLLSEVSPDHGQLFTLHLHENFPLNLESCLLCFPVADLPAKDIISQLRQWETVALQKVVIISLHKQQQQELRPYGLDSTTLFIVPDCVELSQWLLLSNPIPAFAKVLSAQLKITQISPYQTRSGVNKDAVFFGRAQTLAHILNREPSNYLVVGGRQLGKSSILKHLHRRYQGHSDIECHYITLHGDTIHSQLAAALGLKTDGQLIDLLDYFRYNGHKKRYLLLIDEADMFIKCEMEHQYQTLNQFRSLSEEGRCFFVLAGFWNLYQASVLEYQSPLKNFGEPVIIGALEKEACLELITKPMDVLHIRYRGDFQFNTLIYATGRRANLIAIACNEMLKNLGNERRVLENNDLLHALASDAIYDALAGWESLTNDENASRLDRIIVYATVKQNRFTMADVMAILEKKGFNYTPEDLKHALLRLTLSFVLKRVQHGQYAYCVPVFRKILLEDDVDELLAWELQS